MGPVGRHEGGLLVGRFGQMGWLAALVLVGACNVDPGHPDQDVAYRLGDDGDANSGERGNVKISEVMWAGSVKNDGTWDPTDVFIEVRNEGSRPLNLSGWHLDMRGTREVGYILPETDRKVDVGEHVIFAAKDTGCFPNADFILKGLEFSFNDAFYLTLRDRDEHLIESGGSRSVEPFAGGYDLVRARSMERVELMFGGRGTDPHAWHHYNDGEVDKPNNDLVAENCNQRTLASPSRANSPDYSGAFASGSLE